MCLSAVKLDHSGELFWDTHRWLNAWVSVFWAWRIDLNKGVPTLFAYCEKLIWKCFFKFTQGSCPWMAFAWKFFRSLAFTAHRKNISYRKVSKVSFLNRMLPFVATSVCIAQVVPCGMWVQCNAEGLALGRYAMLCGVVVQGGKRQHYERVGANYSYVPCPLTITITNHHHHHHHHCGHHYHHHLLLLFSPLFCLFSVSCPCFFLSIFLICHSQTYLG